MAQPPNFPQQQQQLRPYVQQIDVQQIDAQLAQINAQVHQIFAQFNQMLARGLPALHQPMDPIVEKPKSNLPG